MTMPAQAILADQIFDGLEIHHGMAVVFDGSNIDQIIASTDIPPEVEKTHVSGLLAPGFVDLQVNGGAGLMLNQAPSLASLSKMAAAHANLGTTTILPTVITDTDSVHDAAISAVEEAVAKGVPGIAGLHLEGPHLASSRNGAHDRDKIRTLNDADVARYLVASDRLPFLKITLAPETVTRKIIQELASQGILISLGHSDASYDQAAVATKAGARCVTHLFNAMSQMTARAPGLVGAALDLPELFAGLIADGHHVAPAMIRRALAAKAGAQKAFLVSDSMATAGSDIQSFELGHAKVFWQNDRLTLADGTLAGAHLPLNKAVFNLIKWNAASLEQALAMATSVPAQVLGRKDIGQLKNGARADFVLLDSKTLDLKSVWQGGAALSLESR